MTRRKNQGRPVAKKRSKLEEFQANLTALLESVPEDLRLPSLSVSRLEGYSYLFLVVLPLLGAEGHPVSPDPMLQDLFFAIDQRFGGCLVPSASSHPPYWGLWHPPGTKAAEGEMDYVTTIQILANPIEPT